MAITFERTAYAGHFPEIWRGECKMLPGGFKPLQDIPAGTILRRATPIHVNFENMTAAICKTAKVLAGGTTTAIRVPKDGYFTAGDIIMKNGVNTKSVTISSIDKSNSAYDVLNVSAALTGVAEGDIVVECTAYSEGNPAKPKYTPNFIVGEEQKFDGKGLPAIDAAYDAVVLYEAMNTPMLAEWLDGVFLKANPNILFIKQ